MATETRSRTRRKDSAKGKPRRKDAASVKDGVIRPGAKPAKKTKGKKKDSKKKGGKKGKKRAKRRTFTAKTADRHELYQLSVQSPDEDVLFLDRVYRTFRKKKPVHFREDFCGTGLLTSTWIRKWKERTAEGFDIDAEVLSWGMEHNFEPLGEAANRATLHMKDVRAPSHTPPDVRSAQNFSYFVFKERAALLEYFKSAYEDLAKDGVFVLDIYGGPESMDIMEEVRKVDEGFTYVWDQDEYWPATGDFQTYIHFRFKDGTELKKAFRYDWRLWFLTEVRDTLIQAGFPTVETYWEGTDENGVDGNGVYRRSRKGENCLSWVTYLVAVK